MSQLFDSTITAESNGMASEEVFISVEDMYQAFKERLIKELLVDVHGAQNYGVLKDAELKP